MTDYDPKSFGVAMREFARNDFPKWVGDAHAALITMVGNGAIQRTTIKSGRLVNNWQGWVGDSTISSKASEVTSFTPSPAQAQQQVQSLANDVRNAGRSGQIIEKTLILNNAPYAGVEEEGNAKRKGKHMALGAIDEAESKWGETGGP